ncbi:hypothetical protein T484DRAFT_1803309 [Baffinella frigidus]|nr:hypothetical protein T484DRAFT_1803309 [Cryptophyta sp. CCMP2293]
MVQGRKRGREEPSGDRPYHCTICGQAFSWSNNQAKHMRSHTGEKPYHCTICGQAFSDASNLAVHMRTPTGEKPHACTICGQAFSRSDGLTEHMNRVHVLPRCSVCNKYFSGHECLAAHLRIHIVDAPEQVSTEERLARIEGMVQAVQAVQATFPLHLITNSTLSSASALTMDISILS